MGDVGYRREGPLAVITLQRPVVLNALTLAMIGDIRRFALEAERDPAVTAICITGEGRGFCAGIDMSVLVAHTRGEAPSGDADPDANPALFSFLLDISKPVIAALNGVAAGGGFVLAMMCDLRFMSDTAALTTVFSRRGLIAEHGTSWLLPRIVGLSRALDLLWSSRKVDAAEAYRIGLADRVIPGDRLLAGVAAYVSELAAQVSPRALAEMKAQVLGHQHADLLAACRDSAARMQTALAHPDAAEGAASFGERRPPQFAAWTGQEG